MLLRIYTSYVVIARVSFAQAQFMYRDFSSPSTSALSQTTEPPWAYKGRKGASGFYRRNFEWTAITLIATISHLAVWRRRRRNKQQLKPPPSPSRARACSVQTMQLLLGVYLICSVFEFSPSSSLTNRPIHVLRDYVFTMSMSKRGCWTITELDAEDPRLVLQFCTSIPFLSHSTFVWYCLYQSNLTTLLHYDLYACIFLCMALI
jgi:hypothetical protein